MEIVIRYSTRAHPEDHKPGHCDCSCFGRGFTLLVDEETRQPLMFGRVVSRTDTHVYVDWYEDYRTGEWTYEGDEPWGTQEYPIEQFTEVIR
jgi:hypothetical protein